MGLDVSRRFQNHTPCTHTHRQTHTRMHANAHAHVDARIQIDLQIERQTGKQVDRQIDKIKIKKSTSPGCHLMRENR